MAGKLRFFESETGSHQINDLVVKPPENMREGMKAAWTGAARRKLLTFVEERMRKMFGARRHTKFFPYPTLILSAPEEEHPFWEKLGFWKERKPYKDEESSLLHKKVRP